VTDARARPADWGVIFSSDCAAPESSATTRQGIKNTLAQGFVGTLAGIGASLSTTFFGHIVGNFGNVIGFLGIAAAALSTVFLAWSLMPETKPSNEKGELLGST
jgi:hypothetical protein